MSNVNVIQGLFILAAWGDGGTGSNKPTESSKVMNLTIIQAHLAALPVHSAFLFMANCNKYPSCSVQFVLSSCLWASQRGNKIVDWHTHYTSSQCQNCLSFWLEKGLMLDPSNTYAALHQGFSRDVSPTPAMLDTMKGAAKSAGMLLRACNLLPTVYLTSS